MSRATAQGRAHSFNLTLVALVAIALAGCRDHERLDGPTAAMLSDPPRRHAIGFATSTEALHVEVAPDGHGLSGNQATDVVQFLQRYRAEAHGPLKVAAPGSPRGHLSAARSYRQIEDIIDEAGIPPEAIVRERVRGRAGEGPEVRLAYERPLAQAPDCGNWPEDLGRVDRNKLPYENFGCATARNLAMTVANARDLQVPQEETPRSSERRSVSWTKYVGASGSGGAPSGASSAGPAGAPAPTSATK